MKWPDRVPKSFPDALEHSFVILDVVHGDYEAALYSVQTLMECGEFTADYGARLRFLLTPQGEC